MDDRLRLLAIVGFRSDVMGIDASVDAVVDEKPFWSDRAVGLFFNPGGTSLKDHVCSTVMHDKNPAGAQHLSAGS